MNNNTIISENNIIFANIVLQLSKFSKCVSLKVASILVKNNRIISSGINGTISGFTNCNEKFVGFIKERDKDSHGNWSNLFEIHAEMNALFFALNNNIDIKGSVIYCTHFPCFNCLKHILLSGIKKIYYIHEYNNSKVTKEMIEEYKNSNLLESIIKIPEEFLTK